MNRVAGAEEKQLQVTYELTSESLRGAGAPDTARRLDLSHISSND